MNARRSTRLALILVPAIVAMTFQLIATARFGAGLSPDSAVYIQGARRLAAGDGFTQLWPNPAGPQSVPITWYPPGYSALLSIGGRLGIDAIPFARYVAAALLGCYVAIAMSRALKLSRSIEASVIAAVLIALSTDQLEVFSYALSEPLFIATTLASLGLLARSLERGSARVLIASACFASLAGLTRYIGIIIAPMAALLILLLSRNPLRRRLLDAIAFCAVALAGNAIWFARNRIATGSSTGRPMQWHPASLDHLQSLFATFSQWVLHPEIAAWLWWLGVIIVLACSIVIVLALRRTHRHDRALPVILAVFVATYLLALAASISLIDAATPVDYRLLSPLFAPIVILLVFAYQQAWRWKRSVAISLLILFAFATGNALIRTPMWVFRANQSGERLAYASSHWTRSRTMKLLHRVPSQTPIWTNASDATYLHAGRVDRLIPFKYTRDGTREINGYPDAIKSLRETVLRDGGAVIVFDGVLRRGSPTVEDLDDDLAGLRRIEYPGDATIWAHPSAARRFQPATAPSTMPAR